MSYGKTGFGVVADVGTGQLAAGGTANKSVLPVLVAVLICGSVDVDRSGAVMSGIEFRGGMGQ